MLNLADAVTLVSAEPHPKTAGGCMRAAQLEVRHNHENNRARLSGTPWVTTTPSNDIIRYHWRWS